MSCLRRHRRTPRPPRRSESGPEDLVLPPPTRRRPTVPSSPHALVTLPGSTSNTIRGQTIYRGPEAPSPHVLTQTTAAWFLPTTRLLTLLPSRRPPKDSLPFFDVLGHAELNCERQLHQPVSPYPDVLDPREHSSRAAGKRGRPSGQGSQALSLCLPEIPPSRQASHPRFAWVVAMCCGMLAVFASFSGRGT